MCEIITMGLRLAHASILTYRFWGDASREESLFGVTPRARRHNKKMRGVTPTPARSPDWKSMGVEAYSYAA